MRRHLRPPRLLGAAYLFAASILFSACDAFSSPQNTFNPAGKVAELQKRDFLLVMWPALVIGVGVMAACLMIPIMFRRKKGDPGLPKQVHGNTPLELTWTILPAILLAVIAVPTVAGIQDLGRAPSKEALEVQVTGQRFSWLFEYPEIDAGGAPLASLPDDNAQPNEDGIVESVLRIPVGREIAIRLHSVDVNHSFWVPKLAGKTDVIPNHPNHMWIRADEAGTFEGQCAEFCGLDHSMMRMKVIAMPIDEFSAWVASQNGVEKKGGDNSSATPAPGG